MTGQRAAAVIYRHSREMADKLVRDAHRHSVDDSSFEWLEDFQDRAGTDDSKIKWLSTVTLAQLTEDLGNLEASSLLRVKLGADDAGGVHGGVESTWSMVASARESTWSMARSDASCATPRGGHAERHVLVASVVVVIVLDPLRKARRPLLDF